MWKHWFDISDAWESTLDNLHNMARTPSSHFTENDVMHQARIEMYQTCGAFNTPDMLTVGQGAQTETQYRSQFFLWSVLGAPLLLGARPL